METIATTKTEQLESLGFNRAALKLKEAAQKKRKMAIAYEHFRYVRVEKIRAFNEKLKKDTLGRNGDYKELSFTDVANYEEVPPDDVLLAFSAAKEHTCFDSFEIAHIVQVKDPILFGRVHGCSDRFFIAQWDDDVKIEDILAPNEG